VAAAAEELRLQEVAAAAAAAEELRLQEEAAAAAEELRLAEEARVAEEAAAKAEIEKFYIVEGTGWNIYQAKKECNSNMIA
jgi:hypothetical protein